MALVRFLGKLLGWLLVFAIVFVGVVWANSAIIGYFDRKAQADAAVDQLGLIRDWGGPLSEWEETPIDDALPLTSVQYIASHNSYAKQPNALQNLVLRVAKPGEPAKLAYTHPNLWQQLDEGVRSIELDLRVHNNGNLRLTHVPLLANGSNAPEFPLALKEIKRWSDSHRGHVPLIVLIEFKSDYNFLDPTLDNWSIENLALVDEAINKNLGRSLLRPSDLSQWPTIGQARDRVIVVMHPNDDVAALYTARPENERTMIIGRSEFVAADATPFVVHNTPDPATISTLIDQGALVRTRADSDLQTDPSERDAALSSGAQIISTDYWAPHKQEATDYSVEFSDGALVRPTP